MSNPPSAPDFAAQLLDLASHHAQYGFNNAERAGLMASAEEIERLTRERDEAVKYRDEEFERRDALANENDRLRAALELAWAWMDHPTGGHKEYVTARETAREALRGAGETKADAPKSSPGS